MQGHAVWVHSLHSVDLDACPTLQKPLGLVRGAFHQSGLVARETHARGVLEINCFVEMDLRGHAAEWTHRAAALKRITSLVHRPGGGFELAHLHPEGGVRRLPLTRADEEEGQAWGLGGWPSSRRPCDRASRPTMGRMVDQRCLNADFFKPSLMFRLSPTATDRLRQSHAFDAWGHDDGKSNKENVRDKPELSSADTVASDLSIAFSMDEQGDDDTETEGDASFSSSSSSSGSSSGEGTQEPSSGKRQHEAEIMLSKGSALNVKVLADSVVYL